MTDRLPDMLDRGERMMVSCDRPRDLIGRQPAEAEEVPEGKRRCPQCHVVKPRADFNQRYLCNRCREKQRKK